MNSRGGSRYCFLDSIWTFYQTCIDHGWNYGFMIVDVLLLCDSLRYDSSAKSPMTYRMLSINAPLSLYMVSIQRNIYSNTWCCYWQNSQAIFCRNFVLSVPPSLYRLWFSSRQIRSAEVPYQDTIIITSGKFKMYACMHSELTCTQLIWYDTFGILPSNFS